MSEPTATNYLVISAIGPDRAGLVTELSDIVLASDCNIEDSRMSVLGGEFALILLASGRWNSIAKLEDSLPGMQERLGLTIHTRRTEARDEGVNAVPYSVEVIALDHPGIVNQLAGFFSARGINIHDLFTGSYRAAHTGTQMFSLNMTVEVPADTHIASLREQFMDFCDQLNLDAIIEPVKV